LRVPDRRDRHGDVHAAALFSHANGLVVLDPLARAYSVEDALRLVGHAGRGKARYGAPENLPGRIPEEALRSPVPADDVPFEGFADDRVVGGLHDGRELEPGLFGALPLEPGALELDRVTDRRGQRVGR